jgi:hypothetical protein
MKEQFYYFSILTICFFQSGCSSEKLSEALIELNREPPVVETYRAVIYEAVDYGVLTSDVIHIDPNGQEVKVEWKGYDLQTLNKFNPPHETIRLTSGEEKYMVESAGNNEFIVNDKLYQFKSSESLQIKFGEGISIIDEHFYQNATKIYELEF